MEIEIINLAEGNTEVVKGMGISGESTCETNTAAVSTVKKPKKLGINTNLPMSTGQNNTTTHAKGVGKQMYQLFKTTKGKLDIINIVPKSIKSNKFPNKPTTCKIDLSPKCNTGHTAFTYDSIPECKESNNNTSNTATPIKKDHITTKIIKIVKKNQANDDSYDRSRSQKQFIKGRKHSHNFLIPVVKTNLFEEDISLQQSFKSETYSCSETDRDSVRIKNLSELRRDKKFRQESTESKNLSENEDLLRLNDKLNSLKMTFNNRVYCDTDK
jgi:hypothetical protein